MSNSLWPYACDDCYVGNETQPCRHIQVRIIVLRNLRHSGWPSNWGPIPDIVQSWLESANQSSSSDQETSSDQGTSSNQDTSSNEDAPSNQDTSSTVSDPFADPPPGDLEEEFEKFALDDPEDDAEADVEEDADGDSKGDPLEEDYEDDD